MKYNEMSVEQKRKYIEKSREWKKENKEKVRLQNKRHYKKHKEDIDKRNSLYVKNGGNLRRYGITLKEYNALLKKQNNVCAICGGVETATLNGIIKKLAVDHCHKTKMVRGLLCDRCNRGLGYFKDNIKTINNSLKYLKKYGK